MKKNLIDFLKGLLMLTTLAALALGVSFVVRTFRPGGISRQAYPPPLEATRVPEVYPPPWKITPVVGDIMTTPEPTVTPPPMPTRIPTPEISPVPVVEPPFIPEIAGKIEQPFWIYYWQGDEVWRIDDQGQEGQLILDTYQSLGQWLTGYPLPGSDCCFVGQRVFASPDGQKLALVVVDKVNIKKGEEFTFSIYTFDIQTSVFKRIDEGYRPDWAPDGKRLAYLKNGELWVAELDPGETKFIVKGDISNNFQTITETDWSPDGSTLLYVKAQSMGTYPELWVVNLQDQGIHSLLLPGNTYWSGEFTWSPDGQSIFYKSSEGDGSGPDGSDNLWKFSLVDEKKEQITRDMNLSAWSWSPDMKWLAISGVKYYEREQNLYDAWLLSMDGLKTLRLTDETPNSLNILWSPDGTRLLFYREGIGLLTLNLANGEETMLDIHSGYDFVIGGTK